MPGPGFEWIGKEEEKEVLEVLRDRWLFRYGDEKDPAFKRKVKTLEELVQQKFGSRHALAVTSGTAALITALSALGIGPGDEVIVPGYTFIASMSSIIVARAVPVLAEIDESLTLDPADVEKKITPRTKAIMAVHMLGNPCNLEALEAIANSYKGVQKSFAMQAGREIRIMVDAGQVNDDQAFWIAKDVTKRIEGEMQYPGQIKVTVMRETRAVEYAR